MPLVVFGLALLVLAAFAWGFSLHFRRKARVILGTETFTVAELEDLSSQAEKAVGEGFFSKRVEVKGVGECPNPLAAPVSQVPCAAFRANLIREYEFREWQMDSRGNRTSRLVRGSETVTKEERFTEFRVRDATGAIAVEPQGVDIDWLQVADRFEPASQGASQTTVSFGPVHYTVPAPKGGASRTLGYRYGEEVLPLGRRLYVLGEAADNQGRLTIRRPSEGNAPFVISLRSEEELLASARRWERGLWVGAVALGVSGLGLLLAGLVVAVAR